MAKVRIKQIEVFDEGRRSIGMEIHENGNVSVFPANRNPGDKFLFHNSKPEMVISIMNLINAGMGQILAQPKKEEKNEMSTKSDKVLQDVERPDKKVQQRKAVNSRLPNDNIS